MMMVHICRHGLFPAHAGVILQRRAAAAVLVPVPRTRGGDPPLYGEFTRVGCCSPHTRG